MIDLRPHRTWIGLLLLAVMLGVGTRPLLSLAHTAIEKKKAVLQDKNQKAFLALRQLKADIAEAKTMKSQIDNARAKELLAPVDRLRAAQTFEDVATEFRISHLDYTLSPETSIVLETPETERLTLASSTWKLTAKAPTDLDAYAFLYALLKALPGKPSLTHMALERIAPNTEKLTNTNITVSAEGLWISNGAPSSTKGKTP